ncbi:hypothetical protein HDU85_006951 [Gaertneriomyces sp. JEL0708]|nr:hypothetical protein HDU85_006951 [Gaertneriomyces sp. JEL0708]
MGILTRSHDAGITRRHIKPLKDSTETLNGSANSSRRSSDEQVSPGRGPELGRKNSFSHTYVIHTAIRASPLSKESPEQNYRGFYNLSLLLLAVSNIRLIVENYLKYGVKVSLPFSSLQWEEFQWAALAYGSLAVNVLVAFAVEKYASQDWLIRERTPLRIKLLNVINIAVSICVPIWISWYHIKAPVLSAVPLFAGTILMLKLVSYALVCADLRRELALHRQPRRNEEPTSHDAMLQEDNAFNVLGAGYPECISFGNLSYFTVAPTLCYQPSFPRTPAIRPTFLFKRLSEFVVSMAAMYLLAAQYAAPTLDNSLDAVDQLDMVRLVERVLKLSIVSVVIWLLMFYAFFHAWLNFLGELLRFGDRRFYLQWWNARDISEYWRLWNTPVYYWGKRHVYMPLIINYKVPPAVASTVVFIISAVLHEVLVGVPVGWIGGWAFAGMMAQLPLIIQTKALEGLRRKNEQLFDTIGNYMFWISFTIGQC